MFDTESVHEETAPKSIVMGGTDFKAVQKKSRRKAKQLSAVVYLFITVSVIIFGVIDREEDVYHPDETQKSTTNVTDCYRKENKVTFSCLFIVSWVLLGVVVGTLVDPLSHLFVEQCCCFLHVRYRGNMVKTFKAYFSGINYRPVCTILFCNSIILVILISTTRSWLELRHGAYFFSGIVIAPFLTYLLKVNTESKVHIPPEKKTYVADRLAWSYYFNYLKEAVPKFKDGIKMYDSQNSDIKLSLDKLLLLIPHDCLIVEDLNKIDKHVEKLTTIELLKDPSLFNVYQLTVNEQETENLAIQYVEGPLKTLAYMESVQPIEAVKRNTCVEEVKLFYRTLFEILADQADKDIKETCILVPFEAENRKSLKDGGLVKCIMEAVNRSRTQADVLGFIKPDNSTSLIEGVRHARKKEKTFKETEQEELIFEGDDTTSEATTSKV